jgi:hypothetical protein
MAVAVAAHPPELTSAAVAIVGDRSAILAGSSQAPGRPVLSGGSDHKQVTALRSRSAGGTNARTR